MSIASHHTPLPYACALGQFTRMSPCTFLFKTGEVLFFLNLIIPFLYLPEIYFLSLFFSLLHAYSFDRSFCFLFFHTDSPPICSSLWLLPTTSRSMTWKWVYEKVMSWKFSAQEVLAGGWHIIWQQMTKAGYRQHTWIQYQIPAHGPWLLCQA